MKMATGREYASYPLIVSGDYVTNTWLIAPRSAWRKSKRLIDLFTEADEQGGMAASHNGRWYFSRYPSLSEMIAQFAQADSSPAVSVVEYMTRFGFTRYNVKAMDGRCANFDGTGWDTLACISDEIRITTDWTAAVAYKNGKPCGAIMVVR